MPRKEGKVATTINVAGIQYRRKLEEKATANDHQLRLLSRKIGADMTPGVICPRRYVDGGR